MLTVAPPDQKHLSSIPYRNRRLMHGGETCDESGQSYLSAPPEVGLRAEGPMSVERASQRRT